MPTRAQLRTSVRIKADQDNSTYPTDAALNEFIDSAARTVWRRCVSLGWKPDRTTVNITANGSASYTVGSDVSAVHSVVFTSSGVRDPLHRVKPEQLHDLLLLTGQQATHYDLIGLGQTALTIELYPNPSSGNYEVRYTKRFPGFANDADTWIGPDGSEELIVLTAAIESVNKEGDPADMVRALERRLAQRWDEVIEAAGWLDSQGQQTVRDIYGERQLTLPFDFRASEGWL